MKLQPRLGIDGVRFGDGISVVVSAFGEPTGKRTHPWSEQSTSFCYGPLTFGFDGDGRLCFIAIGEAVGSAELWGERPFEVARRSADAYRGIKQWLGDLGRSVQPNTDCFGATLTVPEEGVTFCFELPDSTRLEGIQLCPR